MNLQQESRYSPLEVRGLPRLDRFFPDCELGLVELFACRAYGFRDLKKVWFGNTFKYQRPSSERWLTDNRMELAGVFSLDGDVRGKAFEALRKYYGVRATIVKFDDFDAVLDEVHHTLAKGEPALSTFDMGFLQHEGRSLGRVQPHMVGIFAIDVGAGTLRAMDQVRGEVTVPVSQYRESLERFLKEDYDFFLLRCERETEGPSLQLDRDDVIRAVRAAVRNLYSADPTEGLNALGALADDVEKAIDSEQQAFVIPGQWIFSHDRHALRRGLPYWKEAGIAAPAEVERLDRILGNAFTHWFQMDMTIERALYEKDVGRMREALATLRKVTPVEHDLASVLADITRHSLEAHPNVEN